MRLNTIVIFVFLLMGMLWANTDPRFQQASRFIAAGELDKAIGEYRAVLATEPNNANAYFAAAEVYIKKNDYSKALANYRLAYRYEPTMSAAYEGAALVYERLNNHKLAQAERDKDPANRPPEPEVQDTVESAEVLEVKPESAPTPASSAPQEIEKPKENVKTITTESAPTERVQVQDPKTLSRFSYTHPLFLQIKDLVSQNKCKEAEPVWRDLLRLQPGHLGVYFYAGLCRYQWNALRDAEINFEKAIDYPESGVESYYYLSLIYKKQNKRTKEIAALKSYVNASQNRQFLEEANERYAELTDKVNEVVPKDSSKDLKASVTSEKTPATDTLSMIEQANQFFLQKKYSEALSIYKNLLSQKTLKEMHPFALLQIANIYRERRDFRSAVEFYKEVLKDFPYSDWAIEADRALKDAVWQERNIPKTPRS